MWSESVSGADGMREQAACVPRAERRMDRRGTRAKVQAWQELTSGENTVDRNQASAARGRAGRQWGNNEDESVGAVAYGPIRPGSRAGGGGRAAL